MTMAASVQCPLCQIVVFCPGLVFAPLTSHLLGMHKATKALGLMVSLAGLVEQEIYTLTSSLSEVTRPTSEVPSLPCLLCGEPVELEMEVGGEYRMDWMANHLVTCHNLEEQVVKLHLALTSLDLRKRKEIIEAVILKHGFRTHKYNRFKTGINVEHKLENERESKVKIVELESKLESLLETGYDVKKRRYKVRSDKGVKNPNKGYPKSALSYSNVEKKCEFCDYKTKRRVHIRRHMRKHTGERPFKCEKCGDNFSCNSGLTQHTKRMHTDRLEFMCNVCGKAFKAGSDLRQHEVRHNENRPKPFSCEICNHKFLSKKDSERHKTVHYPPSKWFHCPEDECSSKFKTAHHLKRHGKVHTTQARNFECPQCGKKFVESYNVKQHIQLVHDKLRKFNCNFCSAEFYKKCDLEHHNEIQHSAPLGRRFQCKICEKSYPHTRAMKIHMHNVHLKEAKFKCEVCDKVFKYSDHFKRHNASESHKNSELKKLCALEAENQISQIH